MPKTRLLLFLAVIVGVAVASVRADAQTAPGRAAGVIDGDTVEIDGQALGLDGIDAPEVGQTCLVGGKRWRCGLDAAFALKRLTGLGPVVCTPRSGGALPKATCLVGTTDLAETLVRQGYAVALPGAAPAYARAEKDAKAAGLGIWRGDFVNPWQWREGARLPNGPSDPVEVCDIKGAINGQGQRTYYVPTDKEYQDLTIDPERGERYFCSDDAAVLAGWKRYPRN